MPKSRNRFEDVDATTVVVVPTVEVDFNESGKSIALSCRAFVTPATTDDVSAALVTHKGRLAAQGESLTWVTSAPQDNTVVVYTQNGKLEEQFHQIKQIVDKLWSD